MTHSLIGYTDSDFAGCHETRRSRSGNCWFYNHNLIGSSSKVSTAEAEFVVMTQAITFGVWAMSLLTELEFQVETPVKIYGDDQAANALMINANTNHRYTKNIDIKMKYCKEIVRKEDFQVLYTKSTANVADIFTKPLSCDKFRAFRDQLLYLKMYFRKWLKVN